MMGGRVSARTRAIREGLRQRGYAESVPLPSKPRTWRDDAVDAAVRYGKKIGLNPRTVREEAELALAVGDFIPVVGDAAGAADTVESYKKGDWLDTAINAGTTAIGAIPLLGDVGAAAAKAMFLGPMAKNADLGALKKAKGMFGKGAKREAIWNETGWFKGADDKWRFEIDDSQMSMGAIPDRPIGSDARLGDVMTHPALFDAYPDLMQENIVVGGGRGTGKYMGGSINGERWAGRIVVGPNTPEGTRSVAAHEIQHAIQGIEGFAGGGSVGDIGAHALGYTPDRHVLEQANLLRNLGEQWPGGFDAYLKEFPTALPDGTGYETAAIHLARDPNALGRAWAIYNVNTDPVLGYRHLAGEVEARNVQNRLKSWSDDRRALPPWETQDVPEDQQIVRFR